MSTETESTLAVTSVLPGIYHDMPNEVYHGTSAISNSGLRNLAKSPFHFYSLHRDPARPPQAAKPGQLEGTLAHCAVLEPLQFSNRYVIGPDVRANTNEWKAFVERHRAKTVIKDDQHEAAHAQARSVRQIADVAELLSAGHAEVSAYWNEDLVDALTGESTRVLCRCRPDWVHPVNDDSVILVDLKTCSDASPWEFARQIKRKGLVYSLDRPLRCTIERSIGAAASSHSIRHRSLSGSRWRRARCVSSSRRSHPKRSRRFRPRNKTMSNFRRLQRIWP